MLSFNTYLLCQLKYLIARFPKFDLLRKNPHPNVVLQSNKAIYFVIPKVACTSIKATLADHAGVEIKDNRVHAAMYSQLSAHEIFSTSYVHFFKFAFVRNPWDRLVSCYYSMIEDECVTDRWTKNGVSRRFLCYKWPKDAGENKREMFWGGMHLNDFVRALCAISDREADKHFRSQYTFVTDRQGNIFVDFLGRFENLNDDFQRICKKINLPMKELPHLMRSKRKLELQEIDEKLWRMVVQRYAEDFELFDYNTRFDVNAF